MPMGGDPLLRRHFEMQVLIYCAILLRNASLAGYEAPCAALWELASPTELLKQPYRRL